MRSFRKLIIAVLSGLALACSLTGQASAQYLHVEASVETLPEQIDAANWVIDRRSPPDYYIRCLGRKTRVERDRFSTGRHLFSKNISGRSRALEFEITVRDDDGRRGDDTIDVNPVVGKKKLLLRLEPIPGGSAWRLVKRDIPPGVAGMVVIARVSTAYGTAGEIRSVGEASAHKRAIIKYRVWISNSPEL